ncbi:site-2 protease family protein [Crateriforma conspicua]|uniref:site-2 protease family protein n=1 Tax=Crateriforma conspicua TaxID=2527996 RepID=UPI001189E066|nr:site-2 protease family protein [Crateriforma conspicua]QDV61382.1 Putative zinc metalloprotease [Crateriforma conspicua]
MFSFTGISVTELCDAWSLMLAAGQDPGFLAGLLSQVWLWVKVAIGIGLVIFVHELGHFLAAKFFGVKCEKFYVGFDVPIQLGPIKLPRTLGKFQYGETEYGIGILPLGGYVKMLGQDDDPRNAEKEAERIKVDGDDEATEPQFDPRSYPAKPVWQRMIIISAGVIVNVITGILFAAMAYGFGVPYTPAVVGGVTPGGAAWTAGVRPGGEVIAVADLRSEDQLHFNEMKLEIMEQSFDDPDQAVGVQIRYGDDVNEYKLVPQPYPDDPDMRMIGISNASSAQLMPGQSVYPGSVAADVIDDDLAGATVVAIDGQAVDSESVAPATLIDQLLLRHADQDVKLTLQPVGDDSPRDVVLAPQPMRGVGVSFRPGPITAVRKDSPAEKAGIKVGDVITAVDGNENVDAYDLVLRSSLDSVIQTPITLTVVRGQGAAEETLEFELQADSDAAGLAPISPAASDIASGSLGIAFRPRPFVASADQTDADEQLKPGDELKEVRVQWAGGKVPESVQQQLSDEALLRLTEGWEFGSPSSLNSFVTLVQWLPEGTRFQAFAKTAQDSRVIETELVVGPTDLFWHERGLVFQPTAGVQRADGIASAFQLGMREGGRRLKDVFGFLGLLVQGKVKAKYVGGPIRIVQMAGAQAEQGISKQLLFLTMLSMNLAILNFLPIPALDGGHMMFLTAELIRGKRVDEQLEMKLTLAGVLAILALMIFVFANDIIQSS